ncbi:hypothetical protein [Candidatus Tisiphia endosymbiont of Nemotelus uliginosus]|uniref:hypothetical protein n=1 Tax=Candidatus Tisiphia endosymbiont of Nemotelus uliginosus TaxID=3077926 RepID=UPI0035C8D89C
MDFIYGAHINNNIIPYDFDKVENILDLFEQIQHFTKSLKYKKVKHSYLPVYDIVSVSNKEILNNSFIQTKLKDQIFTFENLKVSINTDTNIDLPNELLFEQAIRNNKINYRVKYAVNKIDTDLLVKFIDCYKKLFTEILNNVVTLKDITQIISVKNCNLLSKE